MKQLMSKLAPHADQEQDDSYDAKMQVLHELRDMAMGMMGDKMKGKMNPEDQAIHEVSVSAPDTKDLKHGLDLAKKVVPDENEEAGSSDAFKAMGSPMQDASAHAEDEEDEFNEHEPEDDMNEEEIDAMIQHLQNKKSQKSSQS